jgi:RNA polymerase sigma factor (sigma-70 family)
MLLFLTMNLTNEELIKQKRFDELIIQNEAFVGLFIAKYKDIATFKNNGITFEDLTQTAKLELYNAALKFDENNGNSFLAFAGKYIINKFNKELQQLQTKKRNNFGLIVEGDKELDTSSESGGRATIFDVIEDKSSSFEVNLINKQILDNALKQLSKPEQTIIKLVDFDKWTLWELAEKYKKPVGYFESLYKTATKKLSAIIKKEDDSTISPKEPNNKTNATK